MKYCMLLLSLFTGLEHVSAQISANQTAKVDSIFSEWNGLDKPGASLGIIKDGELIYTKGYGAANLEYNIPNTSESVFRIASTSKQFTAACIVLLDQQKKLSLDDKLSKFFPEFPSYANQITIKHLLNHTSGVRDYLTLAQLAGLGSEDYYTDEMLMQWLVNQQELNFNPGDDFLYSNSGYWLLGQIVNKVSGGSMAEFAKVNVFDPLGMENTHFHNDHTQIVKQRASGYRPNSDGGYSISMTTLEMIGDGGIFTTVNDLKKWDDAFYKSDILNKAFWDIMTSVGKLNSGEELDYASGLGVDTYNGLKVILHGGAFVGYRAEMIRFPEQKFSVILLANRADANPTRMAYGVADIFLKDQFKEEIVTKENESTTTEDLKPISLSKNKLLKYEGTYWNKEKKMSRVLEIRNDTLNYVRSNGRATQMVPISKTKFLWVGPNIPITVEMSSDSKEFVLNILGEKPSEFVKYTPVEAYSTSDLESYSGEYYCPELDVIYTLKSEESGIALYLNGKKEAELTPVKKDVITLSSYLTFEFNELRDAFRLSMGRVKNLNFIKQ